MVPQRPIRFCSFRPGLGRPASCTTIRIPKHEYNAGSKSQSLLGKLVHGLHATGSGESEPDRVRPRWWSAQQNYLSRYHVRYQVWGW